MRSPMAMSREPRTFLEPGMTALLFTVL